MPVRDPSLEEESLSNPAEAYERFIVQNVFVPWTTDLIERARPQTGERVLDLACGTGIVTRSVAPLVGSEGKVTALDISPEMLEVARAISSPDGMTVEWQPGSGTEMPF
ncbi:MAG: methyltransferase domain-containing protein, partial [Actinobacteria bacterium]|nr:methyltransferase domain-containing protein [Actinomycetota bacterium]